MAEFRWFGHNCFRIRAREATIITDPLDRVTGYALPKQTADIVTISHDHPGHANLNAIKPEYQLVRGPGEYEMHDVFITGIRTFHDQANGKERGFNTVYVIEVEGIVICHLGDLGHALTEEQSEAMSNADVLLIPAGGGDVIDATVAAEIVGQLEPKVVIPMQFATAFGDKKLEGLEPLSKALALEAPPPVDKLTLRHSDLGETMRLVVLSPEGDGAKR
ncbi:MAG: MBL fold metallo-hydrolase [Thermomicrobiales bacterium]